MITSVEIETFCYPTESIEKVKQAFMTISPLHPEITHATTHFGTSVSVLRARLTRKKDINEFISRLKRLPRPDLERLKSQIDERVDERGNFYIRFDKFKALDGEISLTDSGESIRAVVKFTTFPRSIEKVKKEIGGIL